MSGWGSVPNDNIDKADVANAHCHADAAANKSCPKSFSSERKINRTLFPPKLAKNTKLPPKETACVCVHQANSI